MQEAFSDYIIYVDESGDHGLMSIDPQHPVFVLAFCIFHKKTYYEQIVPSFKKLKFTFWGHDAIILHSHAIRKSKGDFSLLNHQPTRAVFMDILSTVIDESDFTIVSTVIDKNALKLRYKETRNPYEIALEFCMERAYYFLKSYEQHTNKTHIIIEKRGHDEDMGLELAFRQIMAKNSRFERKNMFDLIFADKKTNSIGLQIADLTAHPIGKHVMKPAQENNAYSLLEKKLYRNTEGKYRGHGLKIFPIKNERAPGTPKTLAPTGNPQSDT